MTTTLRCGHCTLVQFLTDKQTCRRCHKSLAVEEEPIPNLAPIPNPNLTPAPASILVLEPEPMTPRIAKRVLQFRLSAGLSQRALAEKFKRARTYISKIENQGALPTIESLERLAAALGIPTVALVCESHTIVKHQMEYRFLKDVFEASKGLSRSDRKAVIAAAKAFHTKSLTAAYKM